jgi:glycerol kinase
LSELKTDGGAAANNWLMQTQADVLGVTVARPDMVETTALGAAGLAGLASGVWKTPQEFAGNRKYDRFAPATNADAGYRAWQRAVDTALHWARHP